MSEPEPKAKPLFWIGRSLDDLREFPRRVQQTVGFALWRAQCGDRHQAAKPLAGFGGAGVLEIVEDDDGSTYRAVYTVKLAGAVYVLHTFQKKSTRGIRTPRPHIDLVRKRLQRAQEHYEHRRKANQASESGNEGQGRTGPGK